jgi:hypothetical protein
MYKLIHNYLPYILISFAVITFTACDDDEAPEEENVEEVITTVILEFTPEGGGDAVTAQFLDPDGDGPDAPEVDNIVLAANTTYDLEISFLNELDPDDVEDITEEIAEEDEEHMIFFSWDNGLFTSPEGDGNFDARTDDETDVNYNDSDDNDNPLGLETSWTTGDAAEGDFRVVLKHQPDIKSETTDVTDGETDIDVQFELVIE